VLEQNVAVTSAASCADLAGSPEHAAPDDKRKRAQPTQNLLKNTGKKVKAKKKQSKAGKEL
jgi:hypothetical protein